MLKGMLEGFRHGGGEAAEHEGSAKAEQEGM